MREVATVTICSGVIGWSVTHRAAEGFWSWSAWGGSERVHGAVVSYESAVAVAVAAAEALSEA